MPAARSLQLPDRVLLHVSPLRRAVVACIGPATAEAALEAGLPPDVLADEQSVDGLVAALRRYVREQQLTAEEAR